MNIIYEKIREVIIAVIPISVLVLLLHFTVIPMESYVLYRFLLGVISIIIGLTIFLIGVDVGITPLGNILGKHIAQSNKISIVILAGCFLGFFISIAEPDLHILAGQVDSVTAGALSKWNIVIVVSIGIAIMVALGLWRIVYNIKLRTLLFFLYTLIMIVGFLISPEFLAISFDASGATTGALTVPFILALALGVSRLKKDAFSSEEDSFGLVSIASIGAILSLMLMNLLAGGAGLTGGDVPKDALDTSILGPFIESFLVVTIEVFAALAPLVLILLVFQKYTKELSPMMFRRTLFGMLFTFIGLILFLVGVNSGFMTVGKDIGFELGSMNSPILTVGVGFVAGLVTILAEPAVHVLTGQVEDVTSGYVKKNIVTASLAIGVASAVALSIIRIMIPGLELWHYLLPGYMISVLLTFFVPALFIGIAFDSGGVASGPMTATFILAYVQGVASATEGADILIDGFGLIAMVAMTPIISLQVLGLLFKWKSRKDIALDER